MQVWLKFNPLFGRYCAEIADLYSLYGMVTLKIRSRSPKYIQLFPPSKQCIYASLVKIHPQVQKIRQRNLISDISKCRCDLKIRPRSPKSNQLFPYYLQCIYASLVKIRLLVQKITHRNKAIWMRTGSSTRTIYPPPFGWGGIILMQKTDKIDKLKNSKKSM